VKTQTLFVSVFAFVLLQACSSSTEPVGVNCPDALLHSVLVSVIDSASGASIANAVTATAIDGQYFDALTTPDLPVFADRAIGLVNSRAGKYDVYVSKTGYRPWATYNVGVKAVACGTEQAKVTAKLQSAGAPDSFRGTL
jgi:hypothetical protein